MSPFKSPPTKVRVGDKDQRVWNDDDDLVEEDVVDAIDSDDLDDDYEPPTHVDNPWTRSLQNRGIRQGPVCIRENDTTKAMIMYYDKLFPRVIY